MVSLWLKAIRPLNILMVIATVVLIKFALIEPLLFRLNALMKTDFRSEIGITDFILLLLSIVFIAMSGYIFNDLNDVDTDRVNNRNNPFISALNPDLGLKIYYILTIAGLILALTVALNSGNYNLGILQLTAVISLWFYSTYFKGVPLAGNIIVAGLVALVPLTIGIYEVYQLQTHYMQVFDDFKNFNFIAFWVLAIASFAFLLTLIREIIKDIEDLEGDQSVGLRTFPIIAGAVSSKVLALFLSIIAMIGVYIAIDRFVPDLFSRVYGGFIITLIFTAGVLIVIAKNQKDYHRISQFIKMITFVGLMYLVPLAYMLYNEKLVIN
ncbi:MAG TPA: hypothetical protein DDX92_02515 [Flavobacteriales bacterium]|jgi:4-hydroxybenzoate polyprenyltransferase|nr:hypothetical protein [Flavobacteriales bacterium]